MSDDDLFLSDALHYRETERDARVRRLRVAAHAADAAHTRQAVTYPDRKAVERAKTYRQQVIRKAVERGKTYPQQVIATVIISALVCWAIWASHLLGWW